MCVFVDCPDSITGVNTVIDTDVVLGLNECTRFVRFSSVHCVPSLCFCFASVVMSGDVGVNYGSELSSSTWVCASL